MDALNKNENIKVAIRFRPPKENSETIFIDTKMNCIAKENPKSTEPNKRNTLTSKPFFFDNVFDHTTSQSILFETVAKHAIEWVCDGYNATIFAYGPTGCLSPDTKVLLYNGKIKKAKNINLQDVLMGDDNTPRKVLQLFSGEDEMFEIVPEKGIPYKVNKSHVLTLKLERFPYTIIDVPVSDYLSNPIFQKDYRGIITSVEYKEKELEIDPYVLGIILSDSYIFSYMFLSDDDFMNFVEKYNITRKPIPSHYLYNSRENRLKLLNGFLDTGNRMGSGFSNMNTPGTLKRKQTAHNIIHGSEKLIKQIAQLTRSLGFNPKIINKNSIKILQNGLYTTTTKIDVIPRGKGRYNGFLLDGNHRFLLKDCSVTHNSGKTYTMFGRRDERENISNPTEDDGIIPRSCNFLFELINRKETVIQAEMKCSFLEIYREHIRDLLSTSVNFSEPLRIRKDLNGETCIPGLVEKYIYSPDDLFNNIKTGLENRVVASTNLNDVSSRSHAVLILSLSQTLSDGGVTLSKLNLVDLAGSENVGKSAVQGINLAEAQTINKSLSCLGNVIYALTEKNREHIPYRDSRLTYLLQDSLGGNSKTILIATASPHKSNFSETYNTLKFAQRVKEIKNAPKVNRSESSSNLLKTIDELNRKIIEIQKKYEDSCIIIEELKESKSDQKEFTFYKVKSERLEERVKELEDDTERNEIEEKMKELYNRQRTIAYNLSRELYRERIENYKMKNELEEYKICFETLRDAEENKECVSEHIKRFEQRRGLGIVIDPYEIDLPTIDSP